MPVLGRVTLNDGDFYPKHEAVAEHPQLPQFLPRTEWPSQEAAVEAEHAKLNTSIDWEDLTAVTHLHELVSDPSVGMYRHLRPMPPFNTNSRRYGKTDWDSHIAVVHTLFHRVLQSSNSSVSTAEMGAMLRILSYGMHHSTTIFEPYQFHGLPANPPPRTRPKTFEEAWDPRFNMPTKLGRFVSGFEIRGTHDCKKKVWTKRFIVVPVIYGNHQWGMTVFDRINCDLYIFDCASDEFKTQRIQACVHFWMEFWNALGMANTFYYFVPDVMIQPDAKDSGLLCVMWLMDALRNQVGSIMRTEDEGVVRVDIDVCEPDLVRPFSSALFLRDWAPDGCKTPRSALMAVRRILRIMLCNELGLRENEVMTKQYTTPAGNPTPSAWANLSAFVQVLRDHGGRFAPRRAFWTGHGGPTFALPMRTALKPYDDDVSRRHHDNPEDEVCLVDTNPASLSRNDFVIPDWPDGLVHTANHPITRPPPVINLSVTGLRYLAPHSNHYTKYFEADLRNTLARQGDEELNHGLGIILDQIQYVLDPEDGPYLYFKLCVTTADAEAKWQEVWIPVPQMAHPRGASPSHGPGH